MTQVIVDPVELRRRGFEALASALGWVNAVRFVRQYECESVDYTRERDQFLPDWSAEELLQRSHELKSRGGF
jgi:hypothetical protein